MDVGADEVVVEVEVGFAVVVVVVVVGEPPGGPDSPHGEPVVRMLCASWA